MAGEGVFLYFYKMPYSNKPKLKYFRKKLRSNLTPAEAFLWIHLKNRQIHGRRFRRQFSIDNYILDFYCPKEKLCIELDGNGHFSEEGHARDLKRDAFLKANSIRVIRIENKDVFENTKHILECIRQSFHK